MKYNEIIHINENFIPVVDLENEIDQYWSLFIPNDKFRDVLSSTIDALEHPLQNNPVWLQGTYGTGKTHATLVIKHLLCDEEVTFSLGKNQIDEKLKNFREKHKVFPVVLKGTSTIGDSQRFTFTIQTAVKKALKDSNMEVATPSDFENMVSILKNTISLTKEDTKGTILEAFAFEEIIGRLENEESEILLEIENILMEKKRISPFIQENIVQWLVNIKKELKRKYDIDYLLIFWDEFTGALNLPNVDDILLQIQNISEAKHKGISLFIVSHRTRSTQANINQEVIDKIMDRFEQKHYSMTPIATYELMAKSLKKDEEWNHIKNRFIDKVSPLINKVSENEGANVKKALEDIYPIHPYTAFLATFIAQEIGSTERSIFKFLHDNAEYGFKSFIDTFDIDERYFLTADYLWEFFFDDFDQSEDEKIISAINKYKLHFDSFNKESEEYIVVFKVILLLNILYKIAEVSEDSLVVPSRENIGNVFVGSVYEDKVDLVLKFIDENGIINETPNHLFELTSSALPADQIRNEKNKLEQNIKLSSLIDKNEIISYISGRLNRAADIEIFDASIKENSLISQIEKRVFNPAHLQIFLFLCKDSREFDLIKKTITNVYGKDLLKNIIILISNVVFEKTDLNRYLDYMARSIVAKQHGYTEEEENNKRYANKIIESWVNDIKRKYVTYYLDKDTSTLLLPEFTDSVNNDLSKKIFYKGLENIDELCKNRNLWNTVKSKIQAERFVTSKSFDELNQSLKGVDKYSVGILKDNNGELIVNSKLELKDNIPDKHPIKLMQDFVDELFDDAQIAGTFNLGKKLMPLTEAPYGLYANKINIAALSFVLRKYINKIYDFNGFAINETKMKNKINDIFQFWSDNKIKQDLNIRFGSEDEKELINLLIDIFNLKRDNSNQSINNVRWSIRNWIKSNVMPLWLLNYSDDLDSNKELAAAVDDLSKLLKPNDLNIPDSIIQECYGSLSKVSFDFKLLIKNSDVNSLFGVFLSSLDLDIGADDVPGIMDYLVENMPEEVYDWDKEQAIREIIKFNQFKSKEIIRKNLVKLLVDTFCFEMDDGSSLNDVKLMIKGFINDNVMPLWLLNYSDDLKEELEVAVDDLSKLLKPNDLNISDSIIQECYGSLSKVSFDFKLLIKNSDVNSLFGVFLSSLDLDIGADDVPGIMDYLVENIQEDVCDWDKEQVILEIIKFNQFKSKEIIRKNLVKLLVDTFCFEMDDGSSLNDVKLMIKGFINDNVMPLWLLNYSDDLKEELEVAVDDLLKFLKFNISDSIIQECYGSLSKVSFDFKLLIKNSDVNSLFGVFLSSLDLDIGADDVPGIMDYLVENIQEDVCDWDKEQVILEIIKFNQSKQGVPANITPKNFQSDFNVMDKVKKTDANKLKDILISMLNENQQIQIIIRKYLED